MENMSELLEEMVSTLSDTANSEVVVGQAIELGSARIIPLSRVSTGFGGAAGEGDQGPGRCQSRKEKNHHGKGTGSGAGAGAKVRPVGVIIFTDEGVRVEKIPDKSGPLQKIFEKIPDLIEMAHKYKQ